MPVLERGQQEAGVPFRESAVAMELESGDLSTVYTMVDSGGQGLIERSATLEIKARLGFQ